MYQRNCKVPKLGHTSIFGTFDIPQLKWSYRLYFKRYRHKTYTILKLKSCSIHWYIIYIMGNAKYKTFTQIRVLYPTYIIVYIHIQYVHILYVHMHHMIQNNLRTPQLVGFARQLEFKTIVLLASIDSLTTTCFIYVE